MRTIFAITGRTGEYADAQKWLAGAVGTEEKAQARVDELNQLVLELGGRENVKASSRPAVLNAMRKHPRGDPRFQIDYTGAQYDYDPIAFEE